MNAYRHIILLSLPKHADNPFRIDLLALHYRATVLMKSTASLEGYGCQPFWLSKAQECLLPLGRYTLLRSRHNPEGYYINDEDASSYWFTILLHMKLQNLDILSEWIFI